MEATSEGVPGLLDTITFRVPVMGVKLTFVRFYEQWHLATQQLCIFGFLTSLRAQKLYCIEHH